ncbi:MAG: GNAT family N-acetyltransferase [Myxococcota bacterium]
MAIRFFRPDDARSLVQLATTCARSEADFVLNPLWESEEELFADFDRHGADPETHLLVADPGDGAVTGLAGFLRRPPADVAGLLCPIVARDQRRRGQGGELLRAALALAPELGIKHAAASIGTRNRSGYTLLAAHGFRPSRQHFLMRCDEKPSPGTPPPDVEILEAKPGDAEEILDLYHACGFDLRSLETMRAVMADGRHAHCIARLGGRMVAFAELDTHWPERVWVSFVGVHEAERAQGVGSALVSASLERCFEGGARSALLLLTPSNREAVRAYEKAGIRRHRVIDVLEKRL